MHKRIVAYHGDGPCDTADAKIKVCFQPNRSESCAGPLPRITGTVPMIRAEELYAELGITGEMLAAMDDVEIE